jgi:hypothetical protein
MSQLRCPKSHRPWNVRVTVAAEDRNHSQPGPVRPTPGLRIYQRLRYQNQNHKCKQFVKEIVFLKLIEQD